MYTADVSQSNYGAGIMVVEGPASAPTLLNCGPESLTGPLTAGQDIFLLVFGDGTTAATSGTMVLTVDLAPPPPVVNLAINPQASFAHDGSVIISGTLSCDGGGTSAFLFGSVQQSVGRLRLSGSFFTQSPVQCDGRANAWQGIAQADNGRFGGGQAQVDVQAQVCAGNNCGFGEATGTVKLRAR